MSKATIKVFAVVILFLMGGVGLLADVTNQTNDVIQVLPVQSNNVDQAFPDIAAVDEMSGFKFEKLVGRLMEKQGYKVGNLRASNDYGVDLIANKGDDRTAVQVKRSKHKITRKAISDAVAGMKYYKCTKAMVVTNNRFTEDAREFARGTECILIDRSILLQWLNNVHCVRDNEQAEKLY